MVMNFRYNYTEMDDRQIVELVTKPVKAGHPNEEAVAFLIYDRYHPLLRKIYKDAYSSVNQDYYEDCQSDLFEYLRHGNPIWSKLANFEWRSTFGTWLNRTALRRFVEIKPYLIGRMPIPPLSFDSDNEDHPAPQVPDNGVEVYEDAEMKAKLMEAISLLEDADQKFVVLKRLQGYNSKETAVLLKKRWEKHGIVKLNNKGERVTPSAGYVDVRMQRAKENLKEIIVKQM